VSSAAPLPVSVKLNGAPITGAPPLLRPLIKVWGGKVAELDGSTSSRAYDEVAARSEATWVSKYIPLGADYAGGPLSFTMSSELQEGWYNLSSTVSLVTGYPGLVNLTGLNEIQQDDESGTSSGVTGMFEAATWQVHDHVLVGVQKASTLTTLSAISCTSHTEDEAVKAGDKITLTWEFRGAGSAVCTHDGLTASNSPNGKCVSPLQVTARTFSTTGAKHTVLVTFTDVCGRARKAEFVYSEAGLVVMTPSEVLNEDGTISVITTTSTNGTKTSTTGAAGMRSGSVALGAAAGALLTVVML